MEVTNRQINETVQALAKLEEKKTYKLGHVTRLALASNLRRLKEASLDIEAARVGLVKEHHVAETEKRTQKDLEDFSQAYEAMLSVKREFQVSAVKKASLDLDNNDIPIDALAAIEWLLID